jgi:protein-S-isoprenylcysteine O-methyltransferase Ste14
MGLASALANDEPYGFLLMAVVVAVFIPKIVIEEKLMTEHFPDVYPQYRKRVKAIIPFIL